VTLEVTFLKSSKRKIIHSISKYKKCRTCQNVQQKEVTHQLWGYMSLRWYSNWRGRSKVICFPI